MRVLITRPEREATALAGALVERGHSAVIAPLFGLEIVHPPAGFEAALGAAQAILLSSANGARALAEATQQRSRPVFAVGDTTSATAEGLGFSQVRSAAGDGAALADLVRSELDPKTGPLLHVSGKEVAFDFVEALGRDGFEVYRFELYEAREVEALPDSAAAALHARALDAVTFFSPRAAELFARLVRAAALDEALRDVAAVAISPAALTPLAELPFKSAVAASRPTRQAVLDEIDRLAAAGVQPQAMSMSESSTEPASPPSQPDVRTVEVRRGPGLAASFLMGMAGAVVVLGAALATLPVWPADLRALWRGPAAAPVASLPLDTAALRREIQTIATATTETARTALGGRLDDLDKRLRALATSAGDRPATAAPPDPAVAELRSRVEALESRPAASPAPAPPPAAASSPDTEREIAGLNREVEALRTAVQTLNQSVAAQRDQARSLSDAVGQRGATDQKMLAAARASAIVALAVRLSADLDAGAPFAGDLALLASVGQGDAKLGEIAAALQPYAQSGVASRALLAAQFPEVAKAALAEDLADDSLGQRVLGKLRNLVSLRRVGDVPGDEVEARIARAEVAIRAGDLGKAVELVKALPPPVAKVTAPWLARAEAHLAAERAVEKLSAHAVQLLGAAR